MSGLKLSHSSESGISLIEMAIALIVISLLLIPILKFYQIEHTKKQLNENIVKIDAVTKAINLYVRKNGRLPMPARLDRAESDNDYGKGVTPAGTACTNFHTVGVKCRSGFSDTADSNVLVDEIVIGFVPFKDLNLSSEDAIDIYGAKLTYVASRQLLYTATYDNTHGAIRLINQTNGLFDGGGDLLVKSYRYPTATSPFVLQGAIFAVLSHGADLKGAYMRDAATANACPAGSGLDVLNCNYNGASYAAMSTAHSNTLRALQAYNETNPTLLQQSQADYSFTAESAEHFDDTVRFSTTSADPFWTPYTTATGREEIYSREASNANVAIGVTKYYSNGVPKGRLEVGGNMRATGDIRSANLCNKSLTDTNCFSAANIAAPPNTTGDPNGSVYCGGFEPLMKVIPGGSKRAQRDCLPYNDIKALNTTPFTTCPNGYRGFNGATGTFTCK